MIERIDWQEGRKKRKRKEVKGREEKKESVYIFWINNFQATLQQIKGIHTSTKQLKWARIKSRSSSKKFSRLTLKSSECWKVGTLTTLFLKYEWKKEEGGGVDLIWWREVDSRITFWNYFPQIFRNRIVEYIGQEHI